MYPPRTPVIRKSRTGCGSPRRSAKTPAARPMTKRTADVDGQGGHGEARPAGADGGDVDGVAQHAADPCAEEDDQVVHRTSDHAARSAARPFPARGQAPGQARSGLKARPPEDRPAGTAAVLSPFRAAEEPHVRFRRADRPPQHPFAQVGPDGGAPRRLCRQRHRHVGRGHGLPPAALGHRGAPRRGRAGSPWLFRGRPRLQGGDHGLDGAAARLGGRPRGNRDHPRNRRRLRDLPAGLHRAGRRGDPLLAGLPCLLPGDPRQPPRGGRIAAGPARGRALCDGPRGARGRPHRARAPRRALLAAQSRRAGLEPRGTGRPRRLLRGARPPARLGRDSTTTSSCRATGMFRCRSPRPGSSTGW